MQVQLFWDSRGLGAWRRRKLRAGFECRGFQVVDGAAEGRRCGRPAGDLVFLGFEELDLVQVAEAASCWLARLLASTVLPARGDRHPAPRLHLAATNGSIHLTAPEASVLERAFTLLPELAATLRRQELLCPGTFLRYLDDHWWMMHAPSQQAVYQYDPSGQLLVPRCDIAPAILSCL